MNASQILVAAWLIFLAMPEAAVAGAESLDSGPIPVANLTPFVQTRLEPGVPRPVHGRIGEWSLDMTLSYGNTFIMSDNVRDHLEQRGERRALDADDVDALDATGEDYYFLDANVARASLEATVRASRRFTGFIRVPVIHRGGGRVDSLIEGFHDAFGFDGAGRDLVARDRLQGVARLGGDQVTQLDPRTGTYLGDPVLGLRHDTGHWLGWDWQWTAAVKPSLRRARIVVASGASDASLQLAAHRPLAGGRLWLAIDNVWAGGSDLFPAAHRSQIPGIQAIYERSLGSGTELLLQANVTASTIDADSEQVSSLARHEYQFTVGLRRELRHTIVAMAMTENIANFDNSSDIGLHLSVTRRMSAP